MNNRYLCSCGKGFKTFSGFNAHLTLNRDHYEVDENEAAVVKHQNAAVPSIQLVKDWHELFGVPVVTKPNIPNADRCELRERLLREELDELADAIATGSLIEAFDALLDLQYVLDGTFLEFGLAHLKDAGFAEVHRSNMSKAGSDGQPITREDGKILKGPDFTTPDLGAILGGDYDTAE